MLDIKFIRDNPNIIKNAILKKHIVFDLDKFLVLDEERKRLLREIEELRAKQNILSEKISKTGDEYEKKSFLEMAKQIKERAADREDEFRNKDNQWKKKMLEIPNIPDYSVPDGRNDNDNVEIRKIGKIRVRQPKINTTGPASSHTKNFGVGASRSHKLFKPKDHITLMRNLDMLDLDRGAKVAGFRGYFLKNDAVLLSLALWHFVFDELIKKGFEPLIAPSLVRPESFIGTGWLPQGEEEVYKVQDNLYLAGTAEVSVMSYHQGEILNESELPKKYAAISPCFRREAGSYGKDTKGIFRLHEFVKIEQLVLCRADHEESVKWHEEITKNAEEIMQALKIPYRVVINCGGDLGLGQVKKYDIESWVPSEDRYRETHSSSYFHDFQTRRLNIRYKDAEGRLRFAHSLNNTAIATPRILISLLENHQQPDGSVNTPFVLRKFMGNKI